MSQNEFSIRTLSNNSILYIYSERDQIQVNPEYQRNGEVWSTESRQLLVDSVLNGFDIPKFYFHEFSPKKEIEKKSYKYAIVDGKQRLNSLWQFIDGEFPLAEDFEFLGDSSVKAGGMTYADLADKYPKLKIKFDSFSLSVVCIQTEELELIEDMFSRLNEASPLNAAEKRNAFAGPIPLIVRNLSQENFFTKKIRVKDSRYRHLDLATKFLYFEHKNAIIDTKKRYLDNFVKEFKEISKILGLEPEEYSKSLEDGAKVTLKKMSKVFIDNDPLLKSVGMVVLYYLLFRETTKKIARTDLENFEQVRLANREIAASDLSKADYDLIEFDRFTQSPNDAVALTFRISVIKKFLKV